MTDTLQAAAVLACVLVALGVLVEWCIEQKRRRWMRSIECEQWRRWQQGRIDSGEVQQAAEQRREAR